MAEKTQSKEMLALGQMAAIGLDDPRVPVDTAIKMLHKAGFAVDPKTFRGWVRRGVLKSTKVIGRRYVFVSSLVRLVAKSLVTDDQDPTEIIEKIHEQVEEMLEGE